MREPIDIARNIVTCLMAAAIDPTEALRAMAKLGEIMGTLAPDELSALADWCTEP